eukprot:m.15796 g.15796  ORF g.15796 m.15796 type:complete len:1168 (-) comp10754_c0_seq1:58-3561(-)
MAMLKVFGFVLLASSVSAWWRDAPVRERGPVPYPYPADRKYNPANEKNGPDENKINVHLVPHTHDDTGWQVTVDQYFFGEVYYVVDTVVDQLLKDPNRHFIYVEIGFFARWWDEQDDERRNLTKGLVLNGQLEFINGGWCMHDEASPLYTEMVDQTTRGHQFLLKNFGPTAVPRGTWQIDPFGHSNTEAWLLGAESGFESLYWGRTDYQDMEHRTSWKGQQNNQWPQWVWQGSQSLGASANIMAGQLGSGGYGTNIGWDNDGGAVQDNPQRHDYNLDEMVDQFISSAIKQQNITKTNHQLWACGSDFQYQNADHWFRNLDKIIHYVNINASLGGPVKAFYSTPSHYTDSLKVATAKRNLTWEVRTDDVFPLGDQPHAYWSGYFTSRPALKRQVRFATNFLSAARQMEVFAGVTAAQVNMSTTRPSPQVGSSWTDSLEGTIGVATHHDGMSGTERQSVANDYAERISESHIEVEYGVAKSLQKLTGSSAPFGHCNCNEAGNCLNLSVCAYTTGQSSFTMTAWNPMGQAATQMVRIPVTGASWTVTNKATGANVAVQTSPIDNRTLSLPLLYINYAGLNAQTKAAAVKQHTNDATHILSFAITTPAVGFTTFTAVVATDPAHTPTTTRVVTHAQPPTVSNEFYELSLDYTTNTVTSVKNLKSGASTTLNIDWGYYVSSEGGNTYWMNGTTLETFKSSQASGAYLFRPVNQTTASVANGSKPTLEVINGPLVTEVRQSFSDYATHVIRLTKGMPYVEIEWTAGPIPGSMISLPPLPAPGGCVGWMNTDNCDPHGPRDPGNDQSCSAVLASNGNSGYCQCAHNVKVYGNGCGGPRGVKTCEEACNKPVPQFAYQKGKEVVLKFNSGLASDKTFYTDSNGREMVKRVRDARGPSYPAFTINEPVAENYYPVNSLITLDDGKTEMAIVTDVAMGGSSMVDGGLEIMVHRRLQHDDHRGVQEPLNETMCGCNDIGATPGSMGAHGQEGDGGCECAGLTIRGTSYLVLDSITNSHAVRRELIEDLNFPVTLAFQQGVNTGIQTPQWSAIAVDLPPQIKFMTLTSNYAAFNNGSLLFRLAHIYSVDEHPTLSAPVSVDLTSLFKLPGFTIKAATEMTVTANQQKDHFKPFVWPTADPTGKMYKSENPYDTRVPFDSDSMVTVIRPMEVKTFLITLA